MDRKGKKRMNIRFWPGFLLILIMLATAGFYLNQRFGENLETTAALALEVPEAEGILIGMQEKAASASVTKKEIEEKALQIKQAYGYSIFSTRESKSFFLFLAVEIFLAAGVWWCISFSHKFHERERKKEYQEAMGVLIENMHAYIQGDYVKNSSMNVDNPDLEQLQKELDKMGTAMHRLTERLEDEQQHTKTLISDISHQLKTPLAALKINYELLEDESLTLEERAELRNQGKKDLEKLETLMALFFQMSRLEHHMIQLQIQKRNIKETLLEAVNTVIMKAIEKKIEFSVDAVECMAFHDFRWTQEALINLLDNAIKYSPSGTTVGIRLQKLTSYALIEVIDQGMGVEKKERHKIFQRFYRGEQAKELQRDGAGIGLYLAKEIIEQQHGTITVKENPSHRGCCFQVMLPLSITKL